MYFGILKYKRNMQNTEDWEEENTHYIDPLMNSLCFVLQYGTL